jgi:hypothetical protein
MKNFSLTLRFLLITVFLSVLFSSCSFNQNDQFLGGGNNSVTAPIETKTNEIALPLSPAQAISEYEAAKIWMSTAAHVTNNDSDPDTYYVMIFLTNEGQYAGLLQNYILYSPLPFACLETNEALKEPSRQTGLITGSGYTNVYPIYALITSLHYNAFLDSPIFVFKPIRKISTDELATNHFRDFTDDYDAKMVSLGIEVPQHLANKGLFDWLANAVRSVWKAITNIVGAITVAIGNVIMGSCNVNGTITYSGVVEDVNRAVSGTLPGVTVEFGYALGTVSRVADSSGYYSAQLTRDVTYIMNIELQASYCKIGDNASAFIFPYVYHVGDVYVPKTDSCGRNVNINNVFGYLMGMIRNLNSFAAANGILGGNVPQIKIKVDQPFSGGAGAEYQDQPLQLIYDEPNITVPMKNAYWLAGLAHEYGHFLHITGVKRYNNIPFYIFIPIFKMKYPDGKTDPLYTDIPLSLLTEGVAEFFSYVYMRNQYPDNFNWTRLENNYGSMDVLYYSSDSNFRTIGRADNGGSFLYQYDFKRYYKEASILYDLWDNNSLPPMDYNLEIKNSASITPIFLYASSNFHDCPLTNAGYFSNQFSYTAVANREADLDSVSVSLSRIFEMCSPMNFSDPNSPYYSDGEFTNRVKASASILGISQASADRIVELHTCIMVVPSNDTNNTNTNSTNDTNAYTNAMPTNGLTAFYPFCGNANDYSGNGHDCSNAFAVPVQDRFGNNNQAYYFNGTNAYLASNFRISSDKTFSIVFWFRESATDSSFKRWVSTTSGFFTNETICIREERVTGSNNSNKFQLFLGTATFSTNIYFWRDSNWHMFTLVSDDAKTTLYFDTNILVSVNSSIIPQTGLYIGGRYSYLNNEYTKGCIDDVRIYDFSLNNNEILAHYHENGY